MSKVFVIAQGGGPTAVINQTLAGAAIEARRMHKDARVLGARHGVRGVANGDFVDLTALSDDELRVVAGTPSSALGSTRDKPDAAYCDRILTGLRKAGADAFIYIGGNDTASTLELIEREGGSDIALVHAPKTIDNDLVENDHTPGFISAGLFVAQAFTSVELDFRALTGIYIGIVMGRHAGFLAAASAAWKRDENDGPHLVYVPEAPFSVDTLIGEMDTALQRFGRCTIAMSEGVTGEDGEPLAAALAPAHRREHDAHGNVHLSGNDLGLELHDRIKREFPRVRARVDTLGYVPRVFIGAISPRDQQEAFEVGQFAARAASEGNGSVALRVTHGKTHLELVELSDVAAKTRPMPDDFYDAKAARLTDTGMAYFHRLLPPPPPISTRFL
jgi:6-phosphofructokinase 1